MFYEVDPRAKEHYSVCPKQDLPAWHLAQALLANIRLGGKSLKGTSGVFP
jgi:hypothetical protein